MWKQGQIDRQDNIPPPILAQIQSYIQSATKSGNTILHLLVIYGHNKLALKVFQYDMSLLEAQNKKLETPLHCAAKVGNTKFVQGLNQLIINRDIINALGKTNDDEDTALHVAAIHGNAGVAGELMESSSSLLYKLNKKGLSPLYIAIVNGYTEMAEAMLKQDANLACMEDSDGMLPIHVAARVGNTKLLKLFIEKYPHCAELLDPRGRNIFHIAAEENRVEIFLMLYSKGQVKPWTNPIYFYFYSQIRNPRCEEISCDNATIKQMLNTGDYEGNTPLHIAAMKGYTLVMRVLWEKNIHHDAEQVQNKQGFKPLELFSRQLKGTCHEDDVDRYIVSSGTKFTRKLFTDVIKSDKNVWNKLEIIGLGAVLIITIAFAAAFTIPGGYNQVNGTPILGRRQMFRAFILANALAFITAFMSLFALLLNSINYPGCDAVRYSTILFFVSSSSMVVAFGLGMYVTLAPDNMDIAVLVLVSTLFIGSVFGHLFILLGKNITNFLWEKESTALLSIASLYVLVFLWIFCIAFDGL